MSPQSVLHDAKSEARRSSLPDSTSMQSLVEWIAEATAPITGDDFFNSLIELLARGTRADMVLLTQCPDANRDVAKTLAIWHHGALVPNIEFPLAGTPCEQVIQDGRFCFLPEGLSQHFPEFSREQDGAESFIGVPVFCPDTKTVLGHIAVYDSRPIPHDSVAESMFRVIAMRAGAEILRLQADHERLEQEQLAQQRLHELAVVSRRASISEMTSAVTHEIRQPLTQIKTYVQTALRLLDNPDANAENLRHALEQTLSGAQRGEAIIDRLKQWMGTTEMRSDDIDVRELIEETGRLLSSELVRTGAELEIDIAEEILPVTGDRVLLQQVIFNLLRNALEAIERAGQFNGEGRIAVRAGNNASGWLVIEISDTGNGISGEMVETIFQPFAGNADQGMGIGLSLCRSIVETHGGSLELAAARKPTVFRITLPAARGSEY